MRDKLSSFCSVVRGVSYSPYDLRDSYKNNRYYLLRSNNIKEGKLIFEDMQIVDDNCVSTSQKLEKFDIAVCMSNGSKRLVGKSAQFKGAYANFCVGAFCAGFRPNIKSEPNYIYQLFQSQEYQKYIDITLAGSAINNLKGGDVLNFEFNFPPLPQQQKIAKILSTVDTVIEQTQTAIAKYQAIKQGLMHDLFTRGIDVNTGLLRPKQQDAPELYKQSALGWIPLDWEVEVLDNCINPSTVITYGIVQTGEHVEGGIRVLRTVNLNKDGIESSNLLRTTKAISDGYKRTYLKENDIVCNVRASVGDFNIIDESLTDCNLTRGVARISLKDSINSKYILAFFRSKLNEKQMSLLIKGTTFIDINIADLRTIKVLLPFHKEEQELIANSITAIENKIQTEQQALAKYQQLKAGLLQDLLTGKVAVTVNEKEF